MTALSCFTQFLRQSDFCLSKIKVYNVTTKDTHSYKAREGGRTDFALTYVRYGCYHYTGEDSEFDCLPGDVSILPRLSIYSHVNTVPGSKMYVIYFSLNLHDGNSPEIPPEIIHLPSVSPDIKRGFEKIIELYFSVAQPMLDIKAELYKLLSLISKDKLKKISEKDLNKIKPAIDILGSERIGSITVTDLAKACGLCEYTFRELFKKYAGTTPKAYIDRRRIESVESLCLFSDISLTNAALLCGFDDPSYFFKLYKRVRGRNIGSGGSLTIG